METVSSNPEEYKTRVSRHNTRAELMRYEKKLQLKRRRLTRLFIRIGVRFFVIFAVIFMVLAAIVKVGKVFWPQETEGRAIRSQTQAGILEQGVLPQTRAGILEQGVLVQNRAGILEQGVLPQTQAGILEQGVLPQTRAGILGQAVRLNTLTQLSESADTIQVSMDSVKRAGVAQILEQDMEVLLAFTPVNDEKEGSPSNVPAKGDKEETSLFDFIRTPDTTEILSEEIISSNAILIDESTDTIVASRREGERISPASMTKVLTVLVAAEQITQEQLDDTFTMTGEITDYGYINDCSMVGFLEGEEVTVRDLFYGTILSSGGDAALGLAAYVAGSQEAFVEMMNQKLEELGLADTAHFTNCVGLFDEEHYCTVYDMAVIMKAALQNELCREYLSARTHTTAPTTEHPEGIDISNWFIRRIEDKDTGGEVICAKTGYVVQAGSCAVSYGYFGGGKPYICVTADSTTSWRCIYDHVEIYNQYVPG